MCVTEPRNTKRPRELSSSKRVEIKPGSFGHVDIKEKIRVPEGKAVIFSLRKKFGDKGLTLGSIIAEPNFEGYLRLQISNRGTELGEFNEGEPVVNYVLVEAFNDAIIVG